MNIKEFIKKEVMLTPNQWGSIKNGYKYFKEDIEKFLFNKNIKGIVTRQGSASTRTIIKPLNKGDQFDLDIAILIELEDQEEMLEVAIEIKKILKRKYSGSIHKVAFQTKYSILDIDLVPMFGKIDFKQTVINTEIPKVIKSDNLNLRDDFNAHAKVSRENHDNALRESVMLMKYALREQGIKGVPSVVIGILAQTATSSNYYNQQIINHLISVANHLKDNSYVHNPSNYEHIKYENGYRASQVIFGIVDAVAKNDSKLLGTIIASAVAFFGATTGVSVKTTAGSIAGGGTNYAGEKDN